MAVKLRFAQEPGGSTAAADFQLFQNQPNPFSARTEFRFYLPEAAVTTLSGFDELGRLRWQQSAGLSAGNNTFSIDGAVLNAPGAYYYQVKTATHSAMRKMVYQF